MNLFFDTVSYVVNVPYFWISMGMVSAIAIFCGAIIMDGNVEVAWKSLITKLIFITLLFEANYYRVTYEIESHHLSYTKYSYATIVSLAVVTLFWIPGMLMGVYTSHFVKQKYRKEKPNQETSLKGV